MFKKDGGYDLRTNAWRTGKEQSDELTFALFVFAIKILISFVLLLGIRVCWEALLEDFYERFLIAAVGEPGMISYAVIIITTVFVTLYTPYAFLRHLKALREDELGLILSFLSVGLRWAFPFWAVFFVLLPVTEVTNW